MDCFAECAEAQKTIYGLARKTNNITEMKKMCFVKKDKKNILVVGESEKTRKNISNIIKEYGHQVDTVQNGEQALASFNNKHYDLLISELIMPGMTGINLLKSIKSLSPETEVMIITGFGTLESYLDSMLLGVSEYINKPVKSQQLRKAFERIFSQQGKMISTQ